MTKKDYQALATALYCQRPAQSAALYREHCQWLLDCKAIADVLAEDNARFKRALFEEACETGKTRGMRAHA